MYGPLETPRNDSRPSSLGVLTAPGFVAAVLILLANDLVLKRLAPGLLTGKLSDFVGLFAFAVFGSALFPRFRLPIHLATGLAFAAWKSPLVQPLIDTWNALVPFPLGRTVDTTDLLALVVLPLSYRYAKRERRSRPSPRLLAASIVVASLAFAGTSYHTRAPYQEDFVFAGTPAQFAEALRQEEIRVSISAAPSGGPADRYDLTIPAPLECFDRIEATLEVEKAGAQTRVRLLELSHRCPKKGEEEVWLLRIFQKQVVLPLDLRPFPSFPAPISR